MTEDVEVAQPADQQVNDSSMDKGTTAVTQQGSAGKDSVTYEVTTTNGAETAKTEVSRTAITPAQATIISVGTKSTATSSSSASAQHVEQLVQQLQRQFEQRGSGVLRFQRHQLGRHRAV